MSTGGTLLLVCSLEWNSDLLRNIFKNDYIILSTTSVVRGLHLLEQNKSQITAIIVDRPPPERVEDSFLYMAQAGGLVGDIPMIAIITPTGTGQLEERAFSLGASDVVRRPYTPAVLRHRLRVAQELYQSRKELKSELKHTNEVLLHSNEIMIDALAHIIEYRSTETGTHTMRIRQYTRAILEELAEACPQYGLSPEIIELISSAAALHDIGKISIPDHILNKPGPLTPEEMEVMRTHTTSGAEMVNWLRGAADENYLRYAYHICRYHHERWNGDGYPDGLKGEEIPICAQVVGLADVFDALTSNRVYKKAYPAPETIQMILNGECGRFSPQLIECFRSATPQILALYGKYAQGHSSTGNDLHTQDIPVAIC